MNHHADIFAAIDELDGNTIIVFQNEEIADAYIRHALEKNPGLHGLICRVEDTRTGSGLVVQWRDPIPSTEIARREREALWLLEEVLAGHAPRPKPGEMTIISAEVEKRRTAKDDD